MFLKISADSKIHITFLAHFWLQVSEIASYMRKKI